VEKVGEIGLSVLSRGIEMEVKVRLFGNLGYYMTTDLTTGGNRFSFSKAFPNGTTVHEMLEIIGLPKDVPAVVIINNRSVNSEYVLKDQDSVDVFRPSGGG
jgi:sulfur carrier protein ThiS